MSDVAVRVSSLRKTFTDSTMPALDGVTIDIAKNEFFTLLGPSGCGKTTLLRMIAGFETPDSGEITIDGAAMGQIPPNRRPVNTVFQSYALFPHMSVVENIAFALDMLGRPKAAIRTRVAEMIALLRLDGLADRKPGQLSGGQQQRVALGRALAPEPKVLLLDEPLSALDLKLRRQMQIELKRLQTETGITFIFVTHDQEEALTMSDRVAVMNAGKVIQIGQPSTIYEFPDNLFAAQFVGEGNFLPATCIARNGAGGDFALQAEGLSPVELHVQDAGSAAPGDAVVLMIRPERVALAAPDAGDVRGRIDECVYGGSDIMLHATLENGTQLRARLPGAARPGQSTGEIVGFTLPGNAIRVLAP